MRYEIDSGMIEIKEKSILITKCNTTQSLLIMSTDFGIESKLYFCSDIEDDKIYTIEVMENGVINITEGENRRKEKIKDYGPKFKATLNLNVDHSKTVDAIAAKTGNFGRKIKRLLGRIVVIVGIVFAIFVVGAIISGMIEEKQRKEAARKAEEQRIAEQQRIRNLTNFIPSNYLGSYTIDIIIRNEKVLVWDPYEINSGSLSLGGRKYVDTRQMGSFSKYKYITGRIDLTDNRIDIMIDYNENGTFSNNEIESESCTIIARNEYGAGNINYRKGGGVSLFLIDDKTAKIQFTQGKDEVTYGLSRR